ncbi:MAG: HD-GYP domain-containing protein [Gemmatimonadaceae bacterium]
MTLSAAFAVLLLVRSGEHAVTNWSPLRLAATLALLGVGSEFLSFRTGKNAAGSIALVPFAAALLVWPHSSTVVVIFVLEGVVQFASRRPLIKTLFNAAQFALGFAVGVVAFRAMGGFSFTQLVGKGFLDSAVHLLAPAAAAVITIFVTNAVSMSAIIAVTSKRPYIPLVFQSVRSAGGLILLQILVAFYLTWLSVNLGILGTAGMVIPMIAVHQLYRTTTELTNVTEELLDLMVAAIEARDPYTSGHSQRVAKASGIIANALGLSPVQIERVTIAALLHDVGKIDEAFAPILAKEGRLSPEEWAIMKRHPIRGADLVGMLTSLKDIVPAVRHHHENWDGTGYPDGLRGENIPLASRIIMFADTLDAITTDRPYRKALGLAEARSEFVKFRGKQFDPKICDCVISEEVWARLYESFGDRKTPARGVLAS